MLKQPSSLLHLTTECPLIQLFPKLSETCYCIRPSCGHSCHSESISLSSGLRHIDILLRDEGEVGTRTDRDVFKSPGGKEVGLVLGRYGYIHDKSNGDENRNGCGEERRNLWHTKCQT